MMQFLRKALKVIAIVLIVLVVVLVATGFWFVRRPWPQVEGTITEAGLRAPVRVIRDGWGVPHLYAENEHDLFFAQGYVHAQDRLWQMCFNRIVANGKLATIIGQGGVPTDRFFRTISLRRGGERDWASLDEEARSVVEAYSEGVNAYLESHRGRLPLEFTILRVDPEPWTPVDSLTWTKMMSLSLGLNMTREMLRTRLVTELGEPGKQIAHRLLPPYPEDAPVIVSELGPPADEVTEARRGEVFVPQFGMPAPGIGSNSWVVAGSRTASGKPILANDTHLGLGLPSSWYEIGLHGGRFDVVGFSFPSMPTVITGHNGRIAWGITSLATDVQDLFVEKLDDPEQPQRYQFMDEWRDLEIGHETIEVKGGEPVSFDLLMTHHGPIINAAFDNIANESPMALSWTALGGVPLIQAFIGLDLARDWEDFRQALSYFDAPSLSFTYADVDGNIGYQAVGKHPRRVEGHDGTVPVPGWSGEYEWQGFIPFDEMPRELNPERGYVVSANNKVVADDYPYHLAHDWAGPERARRITDLVSAAEGIDLEGMGKIQGDVYSVQAEDLRPYLLAAAADGLSDLETRARTEVENWDLVYETDRVGGAVYYVWQWFLFRNLMGDELGEALVDEMVNRSFVEKNVLADLMAWDENPWFDDSATPEVKETRDDMVRRSLTDAVVWLVEGYGDDPAGWQWGRMHTMAFAHQPLGQAGIGPVDRIFNSPTLPARGGPFTINVAMASVARPFAVMVGPSQRFLADLSDLNQSLSVNSTGQCAHTFHAHREDQIALWAEIGFHPMLFEPQRVEAEAEAVLTLNPQ